jgi:murein DD-endopeptidase MepM/ murein hydrolase activator NlpD
MSTQKPSFEKAFLAAHRAIRSHKLVDERRPWVWPLPQLNGIAPSLIEGIDAIAFDPPASPDRPRILAAYARADVESRALGFLPFSRAGTLLHFLPSYTPVYAAQDGEIAAAEKLDGTYAVAIAHAGGWMTCYRNLERIFCNRREVTATSLRERVRAGDVIGYVGGSCLEFDLMQPLSFELWRRCDDELGRYIAVDPRPRMDTWLTLPNHDSRLPTATATAVAA